MLTPAAFKLQFPEFATTDDARIQLFIDKSAPYFDPDRWGDFFDDGTAHWVAHNLAMPAQGAQSAVTSKDVDGVKIMKSATILQAGMTDPYMRTGYGQRFAEMRRMIGVGASAV